MTEPCQVAEVLALPGVARCEMASVTVASVVCTAGCDQPARLCLRHGLQALRDSDRLVCAPHGAKAGIAVWCGRCRIGEHDQCRAIRTGAARAMAGLPPAHPDECCACSCDPDRPLVPGARWAREPGP